MSLDNKISKVTKDDSAHAIFTVTAVEASEGDRSAQIMTVKEEGLEIKAVRAGDAVTDFVSSALDRAENAIKTKAAELYKSRALAPGYAAARKDSLDIASLGPSRVTGLATAFEGTITMVCNHTYPEQVQILTGYKKLLEEQINVIGSRIDFVKRIR